MKHWCHFAYANMSNVTAPITEFQTHTGCETGLRDVSRMLLLSTHWTGPLWRRWAPLPGKIGSLKSWKENKSFQSGSAGFVPSPCQQMCQLQNKARHIVHQITVEGEITQSLWGCHTAFPHYLVPYMKKKKETSSKVWARESKKTFKKNNGGRNRRIILNAMQPKPSQGWCETSLPHKQDSGSFTISKSTNEEITRTSGTKPLEFQPDSLLRSPAENVQLEKRIIISHFQRLEQKCSRRWISS